jgi:hypothetical protein
MPLTTVPNLTTLLWEKADSKIPGDLGNNSKNHFFVTGKRRRQELIPHGNKEIGVHVDLSFFFRRGRKKSR